MERVRKIFHKHKEILIVDYSDCKGDDTIDVFEHAKQLILSENKKHLVLTIFNKKTIVSPNFLRHVERELFKVDDFIDRQAIIGISNVQGWILKGVNLWYRRQIYAFNSFEEAVEFLVE